MTKKDYIIKILKALINDRDMAKSILILVENDKLDDKKIDAITNIFKDAVKTVSDKIQQAKLQKSIGYLDKLKETEKIEEQEEQSELNAMEQEIENL